MTRDQAEEIWMAAQCNMFRGTRSELAHAMLLLSQDVNDSSLTLDDERKNEATR